MKIQSLSLMLSIICLALPIQADVIDFEGIDTGTILSSITSAGGAGPVVVWGINPDFPGQNTAVVFDTASPTGGDDDLGTPNQDFGGPGIGLGGSLGATYENNTATGKVLIVAEDLTLNAQGLVADPDDAAGTGVSLEFDFSAIGTVRVEDITIIDVEQSEGAAVVYLYDASDVLIHSVVLPQVGDNGLAVVGLGPTSGVARMVVDLNGSGAIDNLVFTEETSGGGQGCTPGYWKQPHHFDSWVGYQPSDKYRADVFGVDRASLTLLQGLRSRGGKKRALRRHAVAAILNASNPNVSYFYSVSEIIQLVQAAYASEQYNAAKNLLVAQNEMGCPLN